MNRKELLQRNLMTLKGMKETVKLQVRKQNTTNKEEKRDLQHTQPE
jgi:hypothetical protein